MEILKTKIQVKIYGQDFELKPPTARKAIELSKALKGNEDDLVMFDISTQFLVDCGLPKETCEELELEHMLKVIEMMTSKKK
jgi:hypothetical protein